MHDTDVAKHGKIEWHWIIEHKSIDAQEIHNEAPSLSNVIHHWIDKGVKSSKNKVQRAYRQTYLQNDYYNNSTLIRQLCSYTYLLVVNNFVNSSVVFTFQQFNDALLDEESKCKDNQVQDYDESCLGGRQSWNEKSCWDFSKRLHFLFSIYCGRKKTI